MAITKSKNSEEWFFSSRSDVEACTKPYVELKAQE